MAGRRSYTTDDSFPKKLPSCLFPHLAHRMERGGQRPDGDGSGSMGHDTDPGDTVLDIFAGSNTTGSAAEKLDRRWLAFEKGRTYLAASAFRFVDGLPPGELAALWNRLHSDDFPVEMNWRPQEMVLTEETTACGRWKRDPSRLIAGAPAERDKQ